MMIQNQNYAITETCFDWIFNLHEFYYEFWNLDPRKIMSYKTCLAGPMISLQGVLAYARP